MILIYSEEITPRLEYISRFIFSEILQVENRFTTQIGEFLESDLPKLNYSRQKLNDGFYLKPHGLLSREGVTPVEIPQVDDGRKNYFFECPGHSDFPFDVLAASFYLVTRYEEYSETARDKYDRYPVEKSILSKLNLLKKPVVDIWAKLLAEKIQKKYPQLDLPGRKPAFISTIDIDNAWGYLHKGFWRTGGALFKAITNQNFNEITQRIKVLTGKENDPYDTFGFLDRVFKGNENKTRFFFLVGDYTRFDKNSSYKNKNFRRLIQQVSDTYPTGIHPSFFSTTKKGQKNLHKEIARLGKITGQKMIRSRQHFLRLTLPETYRNLIAAGITEDYTMGHASQTGFRAGTCTPFYFYDLAAEKTTNLKVVPFQVMDVTMRDYMKLSPEETEREIEQLMGEVKKAGGTFVSIWHNETVTDSDRWKGYRAVFEKMNQTGFTW